MTVPRLLFFSATIITFDGSDSNAYGEGCEPGQGYTEQSGHWSPDQSYWTVHPDRGQVHPDTYPPDGPRTPGQWLAVRLTARLGTVEPFDAGRTFTGAREAIHPGRLTGPQSRQPGRASQRGQLSAVRVVLASRPAHPRRRLPGRADHRPHGAGGGPMTAHMGRTAPLAGLPPGWADGWCQHWCHRSPTWRHRNHPGFDPERYTVVELAERPARLFTTTHHYAASWPAARLRYGLIDRTPRLDDYPDPHPSELSLAGRLVGVAVLTVPMHPRVVLAPFPDLVRTLRRSTWEDSLFLILSQGTRKAGSWPARSGWPPGSACAGSWRSAIRYPGTDTER